MKKQELNQNLLHAVREGNPSLVEEWLAKGADVNARDGDGETPLHEAAKINDTPAVIEVLLAKGATVNTKSKWGDTPLHWAATCNNKPAVIEALLTHGADINAKDRDGNTPLHYARTNNSSAVKALIAQASGTAQDAEDGLVPASP